MHSVRKNVYSKMYPFLAVVSFLVTLTVAEKSYDYKTFGAVLCPEDENAKAAVLECISLLPESHYERFRKCSSEYEEIGEELPALLQDSYCAGDETLGEASRCVERSYEGEEVSQMEVEKGYQECIDVLYQKYEDENNR